MTDLRYQYKSSKTNQPRPHHHHHRHRHQHPLEALVGSRLLQKVVKKEPLDYNFCDSFCEGSTVNTLDALQDKDIVLLYFGGGWCSSCQRFLPKLKAFYKHIRQSKMPNTQLEVIYVSADRDAMEFESTFGSMPWLAVDFESPHCKTLLTRKCHVGKIPTVVVFDVQSGNFITDRGCDDIAEAVMQTEEDRHMHDDSNDGANCSAELLLKEWKAVEAVPLEEATFSGAGCIIL